MAGSPKSVNTDTPIDSKYLQYINSLSSGGNTTNITSSRDSIKQYVKTKNGIFNGSFGSVGHILTISSGILNLTANSIGAVVVRRMIQINPESSTSDTIDKIQTNGLELPYQELTLIATTNNTITLAHASSVSGTQKNIYCPGNTSYVLAPNEAVKLIYDPINTIWIVTGSSGSSGSWVGTATSDLDMDTNAIILDADGDTYIESQSDDQLLLYSGGTNVMNIKPTMILVTQKIEMIDVNTEYTQGYGIVLDTDSDSKIYASSDDNIQVHTGGSVKLSIGSSVNTSTQPLAMSNQKITGLATPSSDYDASTKKYVDDNAGGGGLSNPVNTTLSMGNNQIQQITTAFFNGDGNNSNSIAGNSGGLDYNVDDTDEIHDFKVDGVSKFTVGNTQINMIAHLSMSGKTIYLDSDVDTTIHSNTDDSIQIGTGGSIRMSISNLSTVISNSLSVLGSTTLGDNGSDLINIPGLVNFTGNYSTVAQTAGNSTGYITILINGSAKKLYYY